MVSIWWVLIAIVVVLTIVFARIVGKPQSDYDFVSTIFGMMVIMLGTIVILVMLVVKGCVE